MLPAKLSETCSHQGKLGENQPRLVPNMKPYAALGYTGISRYSPTPFHAGRSINHAIQGRHGPLIS